MFGDDILRGILTTTEKELKQNLFEDRQQLLEGTVERLSKIIEGPFDRQSAMPTDCKLLILLSWQMHTVGKCMSISKMNCWVNFC